MNDRRDRFRVAAMMFDEVAHIPPHIQADTYACIAGRLQPEDYQGCLGISYDEFNRRKHIAFVAEGRYIIDHLRANHFSDRDFAYYLKKVVTRIVCGECSKEDLGLDARSFEAYAEEVAVIIAREAVENARLSRSAVSAIIKAAGLNDAARARISESIGEVANYSKIE